ncbi:MAG TPA: hypothetical protein VFF72_13670 [Caldimonas sp.]|nr:hypothetical protein [Caldimonas sp.]
MSDTKIVLVLGLVCGIGMLGWALSGVVTGRILTKTYGNDEDGERRYSRHVYRSEEPVWFWVNCATYGIVGIAVLLVVAALWRR